MQGNLAHCGATSPAVDGDALRERSELACPAGGEIRATLNRRLHAECRWPQQKTFPPLRAGGHAWLLLRAVRQAPSPFGLSVSAPAVSGVSSVDVSGRC